MTPTQITSAANVTNHPPNTGLYSLIATCEANSVNPVAYLGDVLLRMQTHPASRIDELLPHNWAPPRSKPST